jgi:hypothetical protein
MASFPGGTITVGPIGRFLTTTGVSQSTLFRTLNETTGEQHDFYTLSCASWWLEMQHSIDESRANRAGVAK